MDASAIREKILPELDKMGLFLVDLKISKDNDITITVESVENVVTLDNCEDLNRFFTSVFNQDEEDYSLTVTSAGLDGEFKVPGQFKKAIGSKVELWMKGGKKTVALMTACDGLTLTADGTEYPMSEINKVKYYIEF